MFLTMLCAPLMTGEFRGAPVPIPGGRHPADTAKIASSLTGASSDIGAIYADRLARRGRDLMRVNQGLRM